MDGWMGGREKGEHFQFPSFPSFIPLPSPTFSSSYKINLLHRKPPIIPHPKRLTCGSKFIMLIPSKPKLAILLFLSLVIIKFSHTERISLRIQSPSAEERKGHSSVEDCHPGSSRSFFIEHLRPFEGRILRPDAVEVVHSVDECAQKCAQVPDCAGANFLQNFRGEPLCSLHSAEEQPAEADSPLVVIFGITRVCIGPLPLSFSVSHRCTRPWAFQKFSRIAPRQEQFIISQSKIPTDNPSITLAQCLMECQENPECASAVYSDRLGKCQLARISPQNVQGLRNYFRSDPDWDIFEANCQSTDQVDPSHCGFSRINHAGFVEPFSSIFLQIRSPEECQKMCLATLASSKMSICRSWTHDTATGRCYLSHLALRGLGRNVLEQMGPSLSSGELDECMNFRLDCRPNSLLLFGNSPLKLFRGHIRSKRGKGCERSVNETHKFVVDLPFEECGFQKRGTDHSHWGTLLVKEGSTELITSRDKMVQANCRIHPKMEAQKAEEEEESPFPSLKIHLRHNETAEGNWNGPHQSVSTRVIVLPPTNKQKASSQMAHGTPPKYRLEVLDEWGKPARKVEMGENGFLEIRRVEGGGWTKWKEQNGGGGRETRIILTDLRAVHNGQEEEEGIAKPKWIQLIDQNGCVSDSSIVLSINQMDPNRLRLGIKFSGFPDKALVSYQGLVKRCQYGCEAECNRQFIVVERPPGKEESRENGDKGEEEEKTKGVGIDPIRLYRRAIPSPSEGSTRHFQLHDDLFEVQSRSALFSGSKKEGQNQEEKVHSESLLFPASPAHQISLCLGDSNCIVNILLTVLQALLLLLCLYLLFYHFRIWFRRLQLTSLLFIRHFYVKLAKFTEDINGQEEVEEMNGGEGEEEGPPGQLADSAEVERNQQGSKR